MNRRIQTITLILILLWGFTGCSSTTKDQGGTLAKDNPAEVPIPAVEAVQARYGRLPLIERLSGTVRAENQIALHPEINAPIISVEVQNGDRVSKGQVLLRLREDEYQKQYDAATAQLRLTEARVDQAKAAMEQVRSQYSRTLKLSEKQMTSNLEVETQKAQLDGAEANYKVAQAQADQARANLQQARINLSRTVIRAPIAGYVGGRNAEVGMQVTPSSQLMLLGELDRVKVRAELTELMSVKIEVGQRVTIQPEDTTSFKPMRAVISRISPFLDPVTHSTMAEIDLKNPGLKLKPGMFVSVDIFYGESQQATLVPNSALFQNPVTGETGIYVAASLGKEVKAVKTVDPNKDATLTDPTPMTFRPIKIIASGKMLTAVSGIRSGDWVITVGQDLLIASPSARVRPITMERIISLQNLQQEDLLEDIIQEASSGNKQKNDTSQASQL
ncbi:MAG TPA: efflux RND transporter periplasmic adaptor subunit [Balneolales bacterium]|nr:efflux RND transporter periplasmic adaptor subunit [Balneolales bacterium]